MRIFKRLVDPIENDKIGVYVVGLDEVNGIFNDMGIQLITMFITGEISLCQSADDFVGSQKNKRHRSK